MNRQWNGIGGHVKEYYIEINQEKCDRHLKNVRLISGAS